MSKIRSKSALDQKLHNYLKGNHLRHKMHPAIQGSPDAFVSPNILVFVDGCFWHSCPKCSSPPKSREDYWIPKLMKTARRDKSTTRVLRREGWLVIRDWEHSFTKKPHLLMNRLKKLVDAQA